MKYFVDLRALPEELTSGMKQLAAEYPVTFARKSGLTEIRFKPFQGVSAGGLKISSGSGGLTVEYQRKIDAFRALGRIFGAAGRIGVSESTDFDLAGVMLEASRNGVMLPDAVKAFLRRFALMGINAVMLYTEDTYEVPGQPMFGYLRGRYTQAELRDLDDSAYGLGIEMFPCIQTLGHLEQILQWSAYQEVKDTRDILLVGEEKTYKLLGEMIAAASAPYRSKRIHVGMDEAHGLGTGVYRKKHGERRTFDIMNEHLARVCGICRKLGLQPMMWSDMYFRMGSATNDYYDLKADIPPEVIAEIPKDVKLVYWDYYHRDADFYRRFIEKHRGLRKEPIVAPGAWNWNRFWTDLDYAYTTIGACLGACRDKKVREVFVTTWGDDGMENDIYSTLPAIQFFAEMTYRGNVDRKTLVNNFRGSCRTAIEGYELAGKLDKPPGLSAKEETANISKWLLWDDPLIGLFQPVRDNRPLRKHYAGLVGKLREAAAADQSKRLGFPLQLARVLALKAGCRKNLEQAYRAGDRRELRRLLKMEVRPLLRETRKLWLAHRAMWLETYKPHGLEVIEIRYGGQITRLQSLVDRLEDYLAARVKNIPEFDTELIGFTGWPSVGNYRRAATPSDIL